MSGPPLSNPHYGPEAADISITHRTDSHIDGGTVRAERDGNTVTRWMAIELAKNGQRMGYDRLGTLASVLSDALAGEWDG